MILRGVDGNEIFKDADDYFRMIFSIYEFNNSKPVSIKERRRLINRFKKFSQEGTSRGRDSGSFESLILKDNRDRLVDLLCFCFMSNHIHLLIRQLKDGGMVKFMSKIGTGFGGYLIRKYKRQGHVFQGAYTAVPIETDEQLLTVIAYIHTNPLSLRYPEWKEKRIENSEEAVDFLGKCKWSSHLDYSGVKNFSSVTQRDFILNLFGSVGKYKEFILDYINQKGEINFPRTGLGKVL